MANRKPEADIAKLVGGNAPGSQVVLAFAEAGGVARGAGEEIQCEIQTAQRVQPALDTETFARFCSQQHGVVLVEVRADVRSPTWLAVTPLPPKSMPSSPLL